MPVRLNGATSGYTELSAPAVAGITTMTMPTTSGTLDRLERSGNILQVVSTTKTDVYSESFSSDGEGAGITGFTVAITPSSTSNKILLTGFMSVGTDDTSNHCLSYRIYRGTTLIAIGDADGNPSRVTGSDNFGNGGNRTPSVMAINFLDSPSTTSSVTYSIRFVQPYASPVVVYLNRGGDTLDASSRSRAISTITAMEVAA